MIGPGRFAAFALLALLLLPAPGEASGPEAAGAASEGLLLVQVYANAARDDEYVAIENRGPSPVDLGGWSLTDGEATATFLPGMVVEPGARFVVTRNSTSYREDLLEDPDASYDRGAAPRLAGGTPLLADAGDEILLMEPGGRTADAFVYGDSTYTGPGWGGPAARAMGRGEIAVRARDDGVPRDSDAAADWDGLRDHRLGQSAFGPVLTTTAGGVLGIVSPDDGAGPILSLFAAAESTLDVAAYTFTSETLAGSLAAAAGRGVRVRLLFEGSPVGGSEATRDLAGSLAMEGVHVRSLQGSADVVKRYRYHHAKYAIADGRWVLVGSENYGDSSFPSGEGRGSRGWSVILDDPSIASALGAVFEEDFDPRRRDSVPVPPSLTTNRLPKTTVGPLPPVVPRPPRGARLVIGPDAALDPGGVLDVLASARGSLWVQAYYIEETWRGVPNPFLEAAFDAARRGVDVRILLDGSWTSTADADGNDEAAARINERARREGVSLEVRLVSPYGRVERVHNKGIVADARRVLVSSLNWAHTSATENREIGILLEDEGLAAKFLDALRQDWAMDDGQEFRIRDPWVVAALYVFAGVASAASLRTVRRGPKGLKPGEPMETRVRGRTVLRRRRGEVRVLPPELVAEPRDGPRGRTGDRGGGETARGGLAGPQGDRGP